MCLSQNVLLKPNVILNVLLSDWQPKTVLHSKSKLIKANESLNLNALNPKHSIRSEVVYIKMSWFVILLFVRLLFIFFLLFYQEKKMSVYQKTHWSNSGLKFKYNLITLTKYFTCGLGNLSILLYNIFAMQCVT